MWYIGSVWGLELGTEFFFIYIYIYFIFISFLLAYYLFLIFIFFQMRLWQVSHCLSFASEVEHEFSGVNCLDIYIFTLCLLKDTKSFFSLPFLFLLSFL